MQNIQITKSNHKNIRGEKYDHLSNNHRVRTVFPSYSSVLISFLSRMPMLYATLTHWGLLTYPSLVTHINGRQRWLCSLTHICVSELNHHCLANAKPRSERNLTYPKLNPSKLTSVKFLIKLIFFKDIYINICIYLYIYIYIYIYI